MPMNFSRGLASPQGAQVPFQRTIEPTALGLFVNLEQRDMRRLRRYEQNWRFYLGQHWTFTREDGEPLVTINLIRTIIDKGVSWMVGNGFTFDVPHFFSGVILPHLKEVWNDLNNCEVILHESALMGAVTGDIWFLVTPIEPSEAGRRAFPDTKTFIRIHVLGSEQVFPVWDPIDTNKMMAVKIITVYVDDSHMNRDVPRQEGNINTRRYVQILYPDRIIEQLQGNPPTERPNPLGEIPVVHVKNFAIPREYYGLSDMDLGLVDLQRELNEKATDVSDVINYHAQPVTVIIGAKVKNLEKGAKKIWSGFPVGTTVENLTLETDLPASKAYIDFIKESMMETAELPDTAFGKTPPISNTSGVALKMANQPMVDRLKRKIPYYEQGLQDINYFILRWKQVMDGLRLPHGFCENCGGRTVDVYQLDRAGRYRTDLYGRPITKKKCYHADPITQDFIDPEDMRVKFVRQFSFGAEIQEAEQWKVAAYALHDRKSFWDPFAFLKAGQPVPTNESATEAAIQDLIEKGRPRPPVDAQEMLQRMMEPVHMPEGTLSVPAEPEWVNIRVQLFNELTGQVQLDVAGQPIYQDMQLLLVPTDCDRPKVFNPLRIRVKMNDALPHDEHLDMQLAVQATGAGIWSRRHAMKEVGIEDPKKMLVEVEADRWSPTDQSRAGGVPGEDVGGAAPPVGGAAGVPKTALQGTEQQRAAANGGDANKPQG